MIITLLEAAAARPPKLTACRRIVQSMDERFLQWYATGNNATAHKAMIALGSFWRVEDPQELVATVALVQQGISTWFLDEQHRVSDTEHTEMVQSFD